MKYFILIMSLVLLMEWNTYDANAELGIAPCMYVGGYDPDDYYCPKGPMMPIWLPTNCTSFVYDAGIVFNDPSTDGLSEENNNNVQGLLSTRRPLYLYISYLKTQCSADDADNTYLSIDNIQHHLYNYNITGFILLNFELNSTINCDDKLKQYVDLVKQGTSSQIGLYVNAKGMIDHTNNAMAPGWFDFEKLNNHMDYYIIGFHKFNPCNDLYKGGTVPLNDIHNSNYSLTTFANALNKSKIAKDKIYLLFSVNPEVNDTTTEDLPICSVTYQKYCENDHYNRYWCADNADSLYQKGKFARDLHTKGIVVKFIDTIDPSSTCDCNNQDSFISFTMMLRGYLNEDPIKDCAKLNNITDT
ncbi:uncharacterized protein LOC132929790 isoform X2 [Rhopalosiphum padi]|uniref:uncharacterized protein LOC132929790 isoform X2 n=1 Tax=Rhopalosiphum padi TaxID=40932 RepID=UPI00298E409A|nr:uncharacterized protein LOC132929790 isoform X2 [Rhopalosiphum padi]XP_060851338.1 uncharacterized protein LOC132929790 isoform X2 [Rhopalosiphum padi]